MEKHVLVKASYVDRVERRGPNDVLIPMGMC